MLYIYVLSSTAWVPLSQKSSLIAQNTSVYHSEAPDAVQLPEYNVSS